MRKPDLYGVLGIDRDADPAAVKKAYRAASKHAHPDAGGDAKSFALVRLARDVLSDTKRKSHYDQTGEFDETPVDNAEAGAMEAIAAALDVVLNTVVEKGYTAENMDVLTDVQTTLKNSMAQNRTELEKFRRALTQSERIVQKFRTKKRGVANRIPNIMENRITRMRTQAAKCETNIAAHTRALEILKDYEWDGPTREKEMQRRYAMQGVTTGTNTFGFGP